MGVEDYNTTAASNTTLANLPLSENQTRKRDVNNMLRQVLADIKAGCPMTFADAATLNGITFSAGEHPETCIVANLGVYYYDSADTSSADTGDTILVSTDGGRFKRFAGATDGSFETLTVADDIVHDGDTNTKIAFTADAQSFETGGTSRLDLSNSGMRLGAANARVTTILDEDNMASDSATALATQQSIKAYTDTFFGSGNLDSGWDINWSGATATDPTATAIGDYLTILRGSTRWVFFSVQFTFSSLGTPDSDNDALRFDDGLPYDPDSTYAQTCAVTIDGADATPATNPAILPSALMGEITNVSGTARLTVVVRNSADTNMIQLRADQISSSAVIVFSGVYKV